MAVKKVSTLNAHKNPSTNEEEFDVENYMNVNWEKIIDVVDNNADELIEAQEKQEEQSTAIQTLDKEIKINSDAIEENKKSIEELKQENTSLKEELERQKEDNRLNGLTEDNEGELLHIENTTGARFNNLEIFGNEKQETREGKNLYNVYDTEGRNFNTTLLKIDDEDKISLEDYTNSSDTTKWVDFNTNPSQKIKANTAYYVITEIFSISGEGVLTVVSINAGSPGQFATSVSYNFNTLNAGDVKIAQITSREDLSNCVNMLRSFLQFTAGQSGSIEFRISILEDEVTAEDFEYEKYGESPSCDYSSKIKCVGDNVNLFDKSNITENKYINGSVTNSSYEYGSLVNSMASNTSDYIPVLKDKNYIFSFDYDDLASTNNRGYCFFDNEKQIIPSTVDTTYNPSKKEFKVTAKQDGYIRISYDKNCKNIKLEQGENATGYSPFNQGAINLVISNKNLYKSNAESLTRSGVEYLVDIVKNTITAKRNEIANSGSYFGTGKLKLLAGTYIMSGVDSTWIFSKARIEIYISNDTEESKLLTTLSSTRLNFTYTSDTPFYISFSIVITKETQIGESFTFKPQIEMGSIATNIVKNEQQKYVIPVQQKIFSKDKFDLKKKKEVHSMKKIVLDGVYYVWGVKAIGSGSVVQFGINLGFTAKENPFAVSNYFRKSKDYSIVNTFVISSNLKTAYFHIPKDSITEVSTTALQNKLKELYDAGNPVTLWVEAEEPEQLDLTKEQIEILDKIEKEAHTYLDTTNVYTEDEVGAIIKTNTNVDLSTMINNVVEAQLSQIGG